MSSNGRSKFLFWGESRTRLSEKFKFYLKTKSLDEVDVALYFLSIENIIIHAQTDQNISRGQEITKFTALNIRSGALLVNSEQRN